MRKTVRLPYDYREDAEKVLTKILKPNYYSCLLPTGFIWEKGRVTQHKSHYHLIAIGGYSYDRIDKSA